MKTEDRLPAFISRKTGELDFAAAGFAGEALDGGAAGGKADHSVGARNAVGNSGDIKRGVLKLDPAGDLRTGQRPANRGGGGDGAGGGEILVPFPQEGEVDPAFGAQVHGACLRRSITATDPEIGIFPHQAEALDGRHRIGVAHHDGPGVMHRGRLAQTGFGGGRERQLRHFQLHPPGLRL